MNRIISALGLAVALLAGCTSYQETSLQQIEAHPAAIMDQNVRVYYGGTVDTTAIASRTARERTGNHVIVRADSVVALRVTAIKYPLLWGGTSYEAKLYATQSPVTPLQVDLTGSSKVEVQQFSPTKTLIVMVGITLFAVVIYEGMKELGEEMGNEFGHAFFGGLFQPRDAPPSSAPSR